MINYNEDSDSESDAEEDFGDGLDFEEQDPLETVDVIRRRRSLTSDIEETNEALSNLSDLNGSNVSRSSRDHFTPVRVRFPVNAPELRPPPIMAPAAPAPKLTGNYDAQCDADGANAMENACRNIKGVAFNENDLNFFFNQVEIKLQMSGVKKNFTKLQAISTILPPNVTEEIKDILRKREDEFPDRDAYLQLKSEITQIFGQPPEADFERAMSRVLSGKPSQLGRAIVNDICPDKLVGCHCAKTIYAIWKRQLGTNIKEGISHMEFNSDTYKSVFKRADEIFQSNRPVQPATALTVAAMAKSPTPHVTPHNPSPLDAAFHSAWNPEAEGAEAAVAAATVAAMAYVRGRGRGTWRGRGGRGQSRGSGGRGNGRGALNNSNNSQPQNNTTPQRDKHPRHKTLRHPDLPPFQSCWRHWTHGKSAYHCQEPSTCPWKDVWIPKSNMQ